ncbi:hypothetical protein CK203_064286 [Vitis vinifera]|uniref:Uncharacterized protein n=1 Tax=Vitis vinifera TaxID=29760 RepID=A0A438G9N3_VITVI|nr:hypothetical protein CK203_064286 [Vitis vinifera]
MAALLYFEEKVHRKKLLRAMLFHFSSQIAMQILEHLGYPSSLSLSADAFARDIHSRQMDEYDSIWCRARSPSWTRDPEEPQLVEIPADMRAPALQCPL